MLKCPFQPWGSAHLPEIRLFTLEHPGRLITSPFRASEIHSFLSPLGTQGFRPQKKAQRYGHADSNAAPAMSCFMPWILLMCDKEVIEV